jgi:5-methylcytosine-specific restriction endonuclease McrA
VLLRNKAAQAAGYAAFSNTPEYGRLSREREAARAGKSLPPYVARADRAMAALHRRADEMAARRAKRLYAGIVATWAKNPETKSILRDADLAARRRAFQTRYANNPEAERARSTVNKHVRPELRATADAKRAKRQEIRSDGSLTVDAVRFLFSAAKRCAYCLHNFKSSRKTLDHIEPLCLGGSHSLRNVVICCLACNVRKGKKPFREWLERLETKRKERALALYVKRFGVPPDQDYLPMEWTAA